MGFGETGDETGSKKQPARYEFGSGTPRLPTQIEPASIPTETEKPRPIRIEPAPRPIEKQTSGEYKAPVYQGYLEHLKLRTEIGRTTDQIYEARCAQVRLEKLIPELLKLSKLLESYFQAEERRPQRIHLSPVERRYVIEAGKLIPWEDLADISGLGSDHPAVLNLRRSLEDGSLPPRENREAVIKLREALIDEFGDENGKKRPESATRDESEATQHESAGLGRLADSFIRIGILVAVGGAIGGVLGAAIVSESIKVEAIKGSVAVLTGAVAEEAIYPSLKRLQDRNPKVTFERTNNRLEKKLRDMSDTSPERPSFAVAKSEVIIGAQAARAAALELHWDHKLLYEDTLFRLLESMKSDVKPEDLLDTASKLRHLGSV